MFRLEHFPLVLGLVVAIAGGLVIYDASTPPALSRFRDRRRRPRAERNPKGQGLVGLGMLCMAAALFGRDTWAYGTLAAIAGTVLLVAGVVMNRQYLKEALLFRGAARRRDDDEPPAAPPTYRIR